MPNGHQVDTRPLWQRVKDMEEELRVARENAHGLSNRVEQLEMDRDALLVSLKLLREEGK